MLDLRIMTPGPLPPAVVEFLTTDPRVAHVVLLPGTALCAGEPVGDTALCVVAREAATDIVARLRSLGLSADSGIVFEEVEAVESPSAERAERAAPGAPEDAIVWDVVQRRAAADAGWSWSYFAFLALATTIAAVAVITDSSILVVGAMVVGPEFGPVSAIAVGLVLGLRGMADGALRLRLADGSVHVMHAGDVFLL